MLCLRLQITVWQNLNQHNTTYDTQTSEAYRDENLQICKILQRLAWWGDGKLNPTFQEMLENFFLLGQKHNTTSFACI